MKILALDPATVCGWAHSCGSSGTLDMSVRRDESSGMRLIRLEGKLNEMLASVGVELVVFEAARNCAPKMQGALVVQAELQGVIKRWGEVNKIDYRGFSPAEVKKFATGFGNASKGEMMAAAAARWPDVKLVDDNHADALWILDLMRHALGEVGEPPRIVREKKEKAAKKKNQKSRKEKKRGIKQSGSTAEIQP